MGFSDIFKINQFKKRIEQLTNANNEMSEKLTELGAADYYQVKEKIKELEEEYSTKQKQLEFEHQRNIQKTDADYAHRVGLLENTITDKTNKNNELQDENSRLQDKISGLQLQEDRLNKNIKTQTNKLMRSKELVQAVEYSLSEYINYDP